MAEDWKEERLRLLVRIYYLVGADGEQCFDRIKEMQEELRRLKVPIEEIELEASQIVAKDCIDKCMVYFGDKACTGDYAAQHIAEDIRKEYNVKV